LKKETEEYKEAEGVERFEEEVSKHVEEAKRIEEET